MHEMGIVNSILDAVKRECARYPGAQPRKVAIKIGELAAVDPDALRFQSFALREDGNSVIADVAAEQNLVAGAGAVC